MLRSKLENNMKLLADFCCKKNKCSFINNCSEDYIHAICECLYNKTVNMSGEKSLKKMQSSKSKNKNLSSFEIKKEALNYLIDPKKSVKKKRAILNHLSDFLYPALQKNIVPYYKIRYKFK